MRLSQFSAKFGPCLILIAAAGGIQAQQFEDPNSIEFGAFDLTPKIDVGLRYDDNLTRSNVDSISSWSRIISPEIALERSSGTSQFTFAYRLRNEDFFSSAEDNYTDHFLLAQADVEFNARNRVIASFNFEDGHDARGTGFSIGSGAQLTSPDQYKQTEFDILYSYGAFNADGRFDLNFDVIELDYDITTPQYRARDRVLSSLTGTFFYRVGAVTDALFEVSYRNVDYQFALDPTNTLNSEEMSYLIGLAWEATAKTSGFAKIGYQEKDFESPFREDFGGVDWSLGVLWEPLEYSTFELTTNSGTNETNGEGNFIRSNVHSLEWRHEWLERLRSMARISFANERYEDQIVGLQEIRSDDTRVFRASVYYQFRRWINLELGYIYDERESNRLGLEYDRNQIIFNALITL